MAPAIANDLTVLKPVVGVPTFTKQPELYPNVRFHAVTPRTVAAIRRAWQKHQQSANYAEGIMVRAYDYANRARRTENGGIFKHRGLVKSALEWQQMGIVWGSMQSEAASDANSAMQLYTACAERLRFTQSNPETVTYVRAATLPRD